MVEAYRRHDAQESELWGTLGIPERPRLANLVHIVETPVATLRHALYARGARVPEHRHECPVLVYGVGGPCLERSADEQLIKRRLTYHPAGYVHSLHYMNTTHVLAFELDPEGFDWPARSVPLLATLYDDVWKVMVSLAEGEASTVVEQHLRELIDAAGRFIGSSPPEWLLAVIEKLHARWQEVPRASCLAAESGVSVQHLCRMFRRFTGLTMQQYSVALRIDRARGLLWGSGASIAQVAAQTGFADQSHLTRVLADHSAKTPRKLRLAAPCFKRRQELMSWRFSPSTT